MSRKILLQDRISNKDSISVGQKPGLWAKTEVIGGYGLNLNPTGKSTLDEVLFDDHNIVPITGVSYVMEQMFGVKEEQIIIPSLYSETGIGIADSDIITEETYQSPNGDKNPIYRYGHFVQTFAVGITGTAENDVTVYKPDYREKSINIDLVGPDGLEITGTMIPFRYTAEMLDSDERKQYFGKKVDNEGITAYYLKRFESDPIIKHIWKSGEDDDSEELISQADVWENITGLNAVESFTEIIIKLNKKDVKEWFINLEQEDRARINTIALFNGQFVKDEDDPNDYGDYRDCRMFSKLCISPEYLNLSKDLNIIYRVYGS